jgi:hypothetical protein
VHVPHPWHSGINDRVLVGIGYRFLNALVGDSAMYATAATVRVADVTDPFWYVAYHKNQTDFFGPIKYVKCFFLRNIIRAAGALK